MYLEKVSSNQPKGLMEFLIDFSKGENGVKGPNINNPDFTLKSYLNNVIAMESSENLKVGYVPMSTYWLLDDNDYVIGICKLRHKLTKLLLDYGGHIGYYIKKSERNKGIGTFMLKNTLKEAKNLGLEKVLITTEIDNFASNRIILKNGGKLEDTRYNKETGKKFNRYWITL